MINAWLKIKFAPFYLLSLLPFPFLYMLSDLCYLLIYRVIRYRRAVVRNNLINAFPEKDLKDTIRIERKFYRHFCDLFLESLKLLTISGSELKKHLNIINLEQLNQYADQKRNVVLLTSHLGNWEWFTGVVGMSELDVLAFYKPLRNKYFDELIYLMRSRFGCMLEEWKIAYLRLRKLIDSKRLIATCIVGDQGPRKDTGVYWTTFLNQDTPFMTGAEVIARQTGQKTLFIKVSQPHRGFYDVEFIEINYNEVDSGKWEIIERYARLLEQSILETPHLWLWSHRRWKLKRSR